MLFQFSFADHVGLYWAPATYQDARQAVCTNIIIT